MNTNPIDQLFELNNQEISDRQALEQSFKTKREALTKAAHQAVIDKLANVVGDFEKLGQGKFELTRNREFRRLVKSLGYHFLTEAERAAKPAKAPSEGSTSTGAAKRVTDDQILAAIPDGGISQTDLAKAVGISKQAIAPRLKALAESGKVTSSKKGNAVIWSKA